ncbi:hypothetical protein ANN_09326, partial [Periplaneta americana]
MLDGFCNERIPNLTGPVDNNDVTLQRNRNKIAGRINGCHGDSVFDILYQRENAVHIKSTTLPCEAILDYEFNTATQRAYQREFGVRNPPKRNTILGLVNKLETTGSLLQEPDKDKRLNYCRWFQTFIVQNPSILSITWNLWPPRSPDLTTTDFFLWGYLKYRVYATRTQTLDDLKHNITQEIQANNRVLQRVASNMERVVPSAGWRTFSTFAIENMGGVIGGRRIKCIRFADDMALLAEEEMILRDMPLELNDSCEQYGMKINANKTKTMVIGRKVKKIISRLLNEAV